MKKPAEFDLYLCIKMCVGEEDGWAMCLSDFQSLIETFFFYIQKNWLECIQLLCLGRNFFRDSYSIWCENWMKGL